MVEATRIYLRGFHGAATATTTDAVYYRDGQATIVNADSVAVDEAGVTVRTSDISTDFYPWQRVLKIERRWSDDG